MNALHELQKYVANDLRVLRYEYFPEMKEFLYRGDNPKRGGRFEETRFLVPTLDFFDDYLFAGNVGGEKPSDYARSVHYHNFIMQGEGVKGVAFGFDVEPIFYGERSADTQPNLESFFDTVVRHANEFLLLHVTDPYKTHAYKYAVARGIRISEGAEISGVVNPFLFGKDGGVYADNLDGYAMLESIENEKSVRGSRILMIGAGGAASSIALEAVNRMGDGQLVILNRTEPRAHELGTRLRSSRNLDERQLITGGLDLLERYAPAIDILISAITENPYVDERLASQIPQDVLFADVNYGAQAAVAAAGKAAGHKIVDGGPMVYYGVERAAQLAFERKLGRRVKDATLAELRKEAGL